MFSLKKNVVTSVFIIFCAIAILSPTHTLAASYTLTFATHATPDSFRGKAESFFLEEVEKATNKAVTFKVFWGESLIAGPEMLKSVGDGICDTAILNTNFFPKQLMYSNGVTLNQGNMPSFRGTLNYFNRLYDELPQLRAELKKYNNELLYIYGVMSSTVVSTKPFTKIEDFKGLKARAPSRWLLPALKELGAQPVSVPWSDCTMALQTNVVDAVFTNIDAIHMVKMEDVAPNVLIFEELFQMTPYLVTINKKKFDAMPKDIQEKIRQAAVAAQDRLVAEYDAWYKRIRDEQTKSGFKVTLASKADTEKLLNLESIKTNNPAQWLKEASSMRLPDAQGFIEKVFTIYAEEKNKK